MFMGFIPMVWLWSLVFRVSKTLFDLCTCFHVCNFVSFDSVGSGLVVCMTWMPHFTMRELVESRSNDCLLFFRIKRRQVGRICDGSEVVLSP
jgi:hypothetical protein